MSSTNSTTGTQSLERALGLLKDISEANTRGITLLGLVEKATLNRTTVYRLVTALQAQGAVTRDERTKRYFLGPLVLALGLAAQKRLDLKQMLSPAAARIAEKSGDTCFVILRSGNESICIDRHLGSYPIKALTVEVGTRRPLGIGAGSLAILSAMSEAEVEAVMRSNAEVLDRYGQSAGAMLKAMRTAQKSGYVSSPVLGLERVSAVGVALKDRTQDPIAALSIAAIAERMSAKRRLELLDLLRSEIKQLADTLGKVHISPL
jgi:DNA-binding IclR family transcriptional regulator